MITLCLTYSEIVSEQLHDESWVFVVLLAHSVQIVDCLLESLQTNIQFTKLYVKYSFN